MASIYDIKIQSLQGEVIDFSTFKDKVLLIVNTASKCGFTPQYEGLQQLHAQYGESGLVIIGCPCNQFGKQEPGDAKAISEGCLINYGVDFLITEKIHVNGANTHPLYRYLKTALPGFMGNNIKWNFTKFLIGKDGTPIKRFAPFTKPASMEGAVKKALG